MKTGGFCHDKYRRDFVETEVLAPAGSIEGLKAALYAGADAATLNEKAAQYKELLSSV